MEPVFSSATRDLQCEHRISARGNRSVSGMISLALVERSVASPCFERVQMESSDAEFSGGWLFIRPTSLQEGSAHPEFGKLCSSLKKIKHKGCSCEDVPNFDINALLPSKFCMFDFIEMHTSPDGVKYKELFPFLFKLRKQLGDRF